MDIKELEADAVRKGGFHHAMPERKVPWYRGQRVRYHVISGGRERYGTGRVSFWWWVNDDDRPGIYGVKVHADHGIVLNLWPHLDGLWPIDEAKAPA